MNFEKERREALSAGKSALESLEKARNLLSGARGWGIYDTFFKGGFISGMIKHSKMEEAQDCIRQAKKDLMNFNKELLDLSLSEIKLNTNDLLGIADIISDGFLADILMQNRINEAYNQVENAIYKVRSLISSLERM